VLHFATNNAEPSRKLEVVEDVEIVEIARLLRVWNRLPLSFRVWMIDQLEIDEEKIRLGIPLKKPDGRWRKPKETPAETQGDLITDIKERLRGLGDSGYDSDDEETQLLTRLLLLFGVTWPDQPGGKTA
jgi:hypothetical protein